MEETVGQTSRSSERVHDAWVAHHERLWRAVLAWSGDREVAGDAVAEAFAQAMRRGDEVRDVGAWVWRAGFRIAAGLLQERNEGRYRRVASGGPDGQDLLAQVTDPASLPEDTVALLDALALLGKADRTVVVLSLVGGWSAAEVGRLVEANPGTVRVRLHRAKARLRTILEESHG